MEKQLTNRLATLSHPSRLSVFRLLMRRFPDALPAGEIAEALTLKASTASVYLNALTSTGLITQRRDGTRLMYTAHLDAVRDMMTELVGDCCQGRADLCPPGFAELKAPMTQGERPLNVLFICTANSARSLFAEAILNELAAGRFNAYSAGMEPRDAAHPVAMELLRSKGHDVTQLHPKPLDAFRGEDAPAMDFVFTVCDRAANEECPPWPGQPVSGHWGVPDPVLATGTEAERRLAFQHAYGALRNRLAAFTELPFKQLSRGSLQSRIDDIARGDG